MKQTRFNIYPEKPKIEIDKQDLANIVNQAAILEARHDHQGRTTMRQEKEILTGKEVRALMQRPSGTAPAS